MSRHNVVQVTKDLVADYLLGSHDTDNTALSFTSSNVVRRWEEFVCSQWILTCYRVGHLKHWSQVFCCSLRLLLA
jgi:hypothetical protein